MLINRKVGAMIGYDCGAKNLNMSTISLLDIDDCEIDTGRIEESLTDILLLQLNEFEFVNIIQCKIEILRAIHYCGMHSHVSLVDNGYMEYVQLVTREMCQIAHNHRTLSVGSTVIDGLAVNATSTRSITFAGRVTNDGSCKGTQYSDPYGTWDDVVVTGLVKITLSTGSARVKVDNNKVHLPSGYTCKLNAGSCVDPDGGYTFWESLPRKYCNDNTYTVIYKGTATKIKSDAETVYSVNIRDTSFSLTTTGVDSTCGLSIYKTEHPKLFIVQSKNLDKLEKNVVFN
ncbi:uncharacterized protein LOC141535426 [Cotesia typhae]|uniref:uncharacterized protein LOC141535426 n=1 Tax=Cotesia typhae TaxID=2053667 RepID=UPI003D686E27